MNILFLTSRIPYPPDRGDKLRTFRMLKELARDHDVHLFSLTASEEDDKHADTLRQWCKSITLLRKGRLASAFDALLGAALGKPSQVEYYKSRRGVRLVARLAQEKHIGLVYTHLIRMAPYAKDLPMPCVLDYTDAISEEYKLSIPFRRNPLSRLFFIGEAKRTRRYEKAILRSFQQAWFITRQDAVALGMADDPRVMVTPNPTDLFEPKQSYESTGRTVFLGNLSVPHNIHAVAAMHEEMMPQVRQSIPSAQFVAAGAGAGREVTRFDGVEGTRVAGFVEDLGAFMRDADVLAAPLFFSAGVQNKILEAMSAGLPVVCTEKVAEAIGAVDGDHLFRTDDRQLFAQRIVQLMTDEDLRRRIGRKGRELVEKRYSWETFARVLRENLQPLLSDRTS